jgi:hypothetical protein
MAKKNRKGNSHGQHHTVETDTNNLNGLQPATADTNESVERIAFDDAVAEGKAILAKIEDAQRGQLRLGELAHKIVHPTYGDRTLAKFAKELGIAPCTLKRYRDVYRAWEGKISAPGRLSYAVLRELATHDDREQIIRDNPNMSKREAQELMRRYRRAAKGEAEETAEAAKADDWLKNNKKWFAKVVALANDATDAAAFMDQCTDEQQDRLLKVVEPGQLDYIRRGGKMLVKLADYLEAALQEGEDEEGVTLPVLVPTAQAAADAQAPVA